MDNSEEGSLLFPATTRFTRSSKAPEVQGRSAPSPRSPPPARWHRRLSHGSGSTCRGTPEDENYVANSYMTSDDSYSVLYPTSPNLFDEPSKMYDDTAATRRRHVSLPSKPFGTGDAVRARSPASQGRSTPSQRLRRPRAQRVELDDRQNDTFRRAAQRHSARGLYHDVDDVSSSRIPSPVIPATFTDSKYTSHARAPRRPQQRVVGVPRRRVTSVPRRVRVVVLSKNGTPSLSPSPPIDEFTDIPPVDLILFEPPKSLTASVRPSGQSLLPLNASPPRGIRRLSKQEPVEKDEIRSGSPPPMTAGVERPLYTSGVEEPPASPAEPATNDRVTCLKIWVLCVATATTLSIPFGTVILSYLLTPLRDMSNLTARPLGSTTNPMTASTAVPMYTFPIPQKRQTVDPWYAVPQRCQAVPLVSDATGQVNPQNSPLSPRSNLSVIFCLYNNTRFYRNGTYDFLPQNIPFALCRNIVYWSFGVRDGVPISRVESFDRTYRLDKLSEVANRSGVPDVRILLTMGGYLEDYAQLSLLGRDTAALSRFVQRTMTLMKSHFLHGVVIHWVEGEPTCKHSAVDDGGVLRAVFLMLRRIFLLNRFSGQLAAIVSAGTPARNAVVSILDMIYFVFIETWKVWYSVPLTIEMYGVWGFKV
ncbi:hypothetical protein HPB52_018914 [Rhipicephalus sanguineus]|uniref:Chitinase n=1 Tax=Rhipicephalus sanguineus TaxID=34632 RepID=A0A9D4PQX5_RHISA|nr:hypothetical protein HPB52_018914 [Rhipicephalus sanguineus]